MRNIKLLQKFAIFLFFFSLNFESVNLFNLNIDFLASKISISILFFVSLIDFNTLFSLKKFSRNFSPLLLYFGLLTAVGFFNRSNTYSNYFDFALFLNIIIFVSLSNYSRIDPDILRKGLFFFALSTFFISLLYFLGISVTNTLEGRYAVLGMNQNMLGLHVSISIFIFGTIIFENWFALGSKRYYLLFFFPFLFGLMIATGSRVAFISFMLGLFLFLNFLKTIRKIKKIKFIALVAIVFLLIWTFILSNTLLIERLSNSFYDKDLSHRDLLWSRLYNLISENIILGVGKTGYAKETGYLFGGLTSPHNVIIEVLCLTGITGLFIFSTFLYRIFKKAYKRNRMSGEILPIVLLAPISGMILSGHLLGPKIVWAIFAFIISHNTDNKVPKSQ